MKLAAHHFTHIKNYGLIVVTLILSWLFSMGANELFHSAFFAHTEHTEIIPVFLDIVIIFTLGFIAYELAKPTVIPSFVLAIFFGIVAQNVLSPITQNNAALSILTTVGAALILFGGGLDTPFTQFKKLIGPILSLAFLGLVVLAFIFSYSLQGVAGFFHVSSPLGIIILLGATLASADPAAIIPCFKTLIFKSPRIKHITISETALTDVTGALLTAIFLSLLLEGNVPASITGAYASLFTWQSFLHVMQLIVVGIGAGFFGYLILHFWSKWKETMDTEGEADAALFLAVPLLAFTVATIFGGSGFLAVFIAGLLFQLRDHVKHVEHFFNHSIEGFMKPLIFMLLGTLVDLQKLMETAPIGIIMALLFMFVMRPFIVFISLAPFMAGKHKLSVRELLFISFVRETGVIPAVLLVGIKVAGIPGSDFGLAIGMWIILLTLIIQPPLTPYVAKALKVAEDLPPFPKQKQKGSTAVLCSRSYTFLQRLDYVIDWAQKHHVENILLLHCPEDKYSEKFLAEVQEVAEVRFRSINERLSGENKKEMNFKFLGRPGTLEGNIEALVAEGDISIIFVGSKMLDYRMEMVKKLEVPFVFLD